MMAYFISIVKIFTIIICYRNNIQFNNTFFLNHVYFTMKFLRRLLWLVISLRLVSLFAYSNIRKTTRSRKIWIRSDKVWQSWVVVVMRIEDFSNHDDECGMLKGEMTENLDMNFKILCSFPSYSCLDEFHFSESYDLSWAPANKNILKRFKFSLCMFCHRFSSSSLQWRRCENWGMRK